MIVRERLFFPSGSSIYVLIYVLTKFKIVQEVYKNELIETRDR